MKKGVMIALLLVAVGAVVRAIFFSGTTPPANASTAAPPEAGTAAQAADAAAPLAANAAAKAPVDLEELAKGVQEVDFVYDRVALARNPMTPLVGPQAVYLASNGAKDAEDAGVPNARLLAQQLMVTGIIWDDSFPVAVINDDVVAAGDRLPGGVVVQAIQPDKVMVQVGQAVVPLPLKATEEQ